MIKLLKDEAGYSLVEVIVSMLILTVAIIPMVGMFDMGLKSATQGSKYDTARALSNKNLEKVKALPYSKAVVTYKPVNATPAAGTAFSCNEGIYGCKVKTTYVNDSYNPDPSFLVQMKVEVTVTWDGKTYTTTGFVASGESL